MKKVFQMLLAVIILQMSFVDAKATEQERDKLSTQNIRAVKAEYMDFRLVKINGKLPFLTKSSLLFVLTGKPDKLTKPDANNYCGSFYNKPFRLAYVGGMEAEIYGPTAIVRSVNFKKSPDLYLTTSAITLNHKTTLSDLRRVFPNAVKSSSSLNDVYLGKTTAVTIATASKTLADSWLLLFQNGKLVRVDYYIPC